MLPVLTCVGVCCYTLAKEGRVVRLNRDYCLPAFLRLALTWVLGMWADAVPYIVYRCCCYYHNCPLGGSMGEKHTGGGVYLK